MRDERTSGPGAADESQRLDDLLIEAIICAGAHIGAVYLLDEDCEVLQMTTELGLPAPIARAWSRIRTNDPVPVAVAIRERRLIWISGREHLARDFPAAALALPYHFAAALTPISTGDVIWGGFMLLWPAGHAAELTARQREVIEEACTDIAGLLERAAEAGRPIAAPSRPRVLDPCPVHKTDRRAGMVALECLNRLPEGFCSLDVEGRVTVVSAPACDLLGSCSSELLGRRPWEALPWLDDPVYEDRYRAAVVSRQVTHFQVRNPAGRNLSFWLYPGLTGITVRISPGTATRVPDIVAENERRPRLIMVHEILQLATSLARAITAQEVIDLVADHVMPVYNVQALAILTTKGDRVHVEASRGYTRAAINDFDGRPVMPPIPTSKSFDPTQPGFFADWDELRATYPGAIRSDDMCAWAFLPLVTSGRPIGTCVLAYDRPHRFSTDERASLTALAGVIAQAFERARMYDTKHQIAQFLQSSLLPRELPSIPNLEVAARYVPATPGMDIGGDFYDLIRLSDTMAAAVIGDVQGHDVTAAALMGQVRTAIHAHATAGASPGEVLAHTNRLLIELSPDRFTSCLYVSLDLQTHTACLASAGHLPPLLGLVGGPAEIIEISPGLLLGIDPDAGYPTTEINLPVGSVLTLYTDGLVEAPGLDIGDAMAALAHRFNPTAGQPLYDLASALIDPVTEARSDDIAVLLMRDGS
ncbi:PAS fold-containing protein [Nonomuraea solani]|uniref:protein-serine/threonine phosphatase n=1 Tax=Nonomuraea solani TaxID=1144553 RepID=A0A1H6E367_9ACTN|nr:SpoIIE family protein phosphatase [Nonomuraea solani]SEG91643.1 PAS fold-containing protein [Nonomuraea solani]